MKISSLTDIVEGKLLNTPSISFITQIQTDIKKVNEGDAFISNNKEHIETAVLKGAFAILSTKIKNIIDSEIAWIEVDELKTAIAKILRYKLIEQSVSYILIDEVFYQFLLLYKTSLPNNTVVLTNNLKKDFNILNNHQAISTIYGTKNEFLEQIGTNIKDQTKYNYKINNFIQHSLFEISFSYKNNFYERIKIPKIYTNAFVKLLKYLNFDIDLKKLNTFDLFKPIFINKRSHIVSNGQTNRFILCSRNKYISTIELNYLKKYYNYGIIKVIDFKKINKNNIPNLISSFKFNALYIKNIDQNRLITILEQNNKVNQLELI
jgi:ferrochelatase